MRESSLEAVLISPRAIFIESVSQLCICVHDERPLGGDWLTQWKTGGQKSFGCHISSTNTDRTHFLIQVAEKRATRGTGVSRAPSVYHRLLEQRGRSIARKGTTSCHRLSIRLPTRAWDLMRDRKSVV